MKILKIIFFVLLISLIFTSGILLGKNLTNKSVPLTIYKQSPSQTSATIPSVSISFDETANWKLTKFSTTISFKLPQNIEDPLYVNTGHYAQGTTLPGNTEFQIWGADGASPSQGKDYYDEIKNNITSNLIFQTKKTQLNNKEAIEFTTDVSSPEMVWGGEVYNKLRGVLIKMNDGRGLVVIHYQGTTFQKNGDFISDNKIFNQILSTFKFVDSPESLLYGYTHKATGFSFNYPSVYKVAEQPMNGGIDLISLNNNDGVKIDIYISDNPDGKTLDELVNEFDVEQGEASIPPSEYRKSIIAGESAIRRRDNISGKEKVFFVHNGGFFEFIKFFNNTKKEQNEFEDILQSITFKGASVYNFGKVSFPYEKSWQIEESQRSNENINTLDFHINSLCINKEPKPIVSGTEMVCDVTIVDYSPSYFQLKEQKAILDLNQFVDFMASQGRDETMATPIINNFVNDKNISITKWVGIRPLTGELVESYFFEYEDKANMSHFVYLYGNPAQISANDNLLKSFVNKIINSIGIN